MRRAAKTLGGLLAGFVAGSLLFNGHVLAKLAPTNVTWETGGCAPGVYTVTSTAVSLSGAGTFQTTTENVQLPAPFVTQVFENLPLGRFSVTATAINEQGEAIGSGTQLLVLIPPRVRGTPKSTAAASSSTADSAPLSLRRRADSPSQPGETRPATGLQRPTLSLKAIADLIKDDSGWRRVDLIDLDDDGEIDLLRIEWVDGAVREWRVVR